MSASRDTNIGARAKTKESVQEMFQQGFDDKYGVPAFEVLAEDTSVSPNVLKRLQFLAKLTQAFEYNGDGNPIYIGEASPGSAKGDAKWRIRKLTYSGTNITDIQWADGDTNYNNVWNDRVSLSYS
jgi:hypothetical protein